MTTPRRPSPLRSPKVRELGDSVRELAKLVEHPSWPALRSEFDKRKDTYVQKIARDYTAGGIDAKPIDQRQIDYIRGFLRGAQAVLDTPENAMKALEEALREEGNG